MVLDAMKLAEKTLAGQAAPQQLGKLFPLAAVAQPVAQQPETWRMRQCVADPAHSRRSAILVNRDVVNLAQGHSSLAQAICDRP